MKPKKKRKQGFNLGEEYRKIWKYVRESGKFIWIIIGIFFVFFLVGFLVPVPESIYNQLMEFIKNLLEKTENMSQLDIVSFIIFNNIQSTFFGITLGVLFGIFPVLSAITNGYILGFVSELSVESGGFSTLWKLFPHGIFELPAVFISLGIGVKLGTFIFQKDKLKALKDYSINSLKVFLLIVIPLLIIAGIIEGTLIILFK